ncbi:MAG: sialic acid O-acetyltransferase [Bacteroidales bacterium]|nr:sialic acid O-acetyltransferase [Bacteroidales bacterium]
MDKVVIIGGKGSAIVVAEQIYDATHKYHAAIEFLGFAFDDRTDGDEINGFPILCGTHEAYDKYKNYDDVKFIYQMYRPDLINERIDLLNSYQIPENRFYSFFHPSCMISRSAKIGTGTIIMAGTVVNPNAVIGKFCTIQSQVTVGHDSVMGDYNFIATQSTIGNLVMGNRNFIGINVSTNNFITIGDNCFIGMASNVVKSVPSTTKVYGNPARPFYTKIKPL